MKVPTFYHTCQASGDLFGLTFDDLDRIGRNTDRIVVNSYPHLAQDVIRTLIRDFFLASEELIPKELTLTESLLTSVLELSSSLL